MKRLFLYLFQCLVVAIIVSVMQNIYLIFIKLPFEKSMFGVESAEELRKLKQKIQDLEDQIGLSNKGWNLTRVTNNNIAIGCAITSKGLTGLTAQNLDSKHPFFKDLLPSFCRTASSGYHYHFYVAHDHDDHILMSSHSAFETIFIRLTSLKCRADVGLSLKLVECDHMGKPAWAQAEAMWEAYLDHMPYYYRINDDTIMDTPGWTETFIKELAEFKPKNTGVVGPNHNIGNMAILTYEFVHRTHLDIFGFYYPRVFTDWFADQWITQVYSPERMRKVQDIKIIHTMAEGTRYSVASQIAYEVGPTVEASKLVLNTWLQSRSNYTARQNKKSNKAIVFSLFGGDAKYTIGAIRNAQLASVYYPEWKVQFYIEKLSEGRYHYPQVPDRIVRKLKYLGAEIIPVNVAKTKLPPMMWRFLAADDKQLEYFIVRDTDSRPSAREVAAVEKWIQSGKAFHCIRDHPSHSHSSVSGGLFGGKNSALRAIFNKSWLEMMNGYKEDYGADMAFLNRTIWTAVQPDHAICHDSYTCSHWPASAPFPVARASWEHVGQVHDEHGKVRPSDVSILMAASFPAECQEQPPPSTPKSQIQIWSQDYSTMAITDLKHTLQKENIAILDHNLNHDCKNVSECGLKIINHENGMTLSEEVIERFQKEYQNDTVFNSAKAVLCVYPTSMCESYIGLKKPMIILAYNRFDRGRNNDTNWLKWAERLAALSSFNLVAAMTNFDMAYLQHYTGINAIHLPPLCLYLETAYTPTYDTILYIPAVDILDDLVINVVKSQGHRIARLTDLYREWRREDLVKHKLILYIPSHISITLYELMRMNIPLFIPSAELLTRWDHVYDVIKWSRPHPPRNISSFIDQPDPNSQQEDDRLYWIRKADFYQWPGVTHFSSLARLAHLLKSVDLKAASNRMKEFNQRETAQTRKHWAEIATGLRQKA